VNYLAHFYLADPEKDLMFGNYIGDGVKGSDLTGYSENVQRGIRFHRFIDSYTDTHKIVKEAKKLFYPNQRKFSGVVVDVLFDHLLALNWKQHADQELNAFAKHCYEVIDSHPETLPIRSERFYGYMVSNNLLEDYGSESGIQRVFIGMDSRTKFSSNMSSSLEDLNTYRTEFSQMFEQFFPDVIKATGKWKQENGG
jgi:acyl carrier protein phosphodiesterase